MSRSACSSCGATVAEPARRRARERAPAPAPALRGVRGESSRDLDALLHHHLRLGLVSALAATSSLTFNDLKGLLETSDGNLSVHARKLEEAGYVTCTKTFENRRPRTDYRVTAAGRQALGRYLAHMEAIIRAAKDTLGR
jgi:DNA-binding MarR family transcriptional regulator